MNNKIHINLNEGQNIYFTSDLHFGHKNVINFCKRPFYDEKEMEEKLIYNWNEIVTENDYIFNLGDVFWFNDSHLIKKIINKLNGNIYIIPGNHDEFAHYYRLKDNENLHLMSDIVTLFLTANDYRERKWDRKIYEIYLCHYPLMTWPHRCNNAYQFFGHIHSHKGSVGYDQDLPLYKNQYDVGVDNNNYKPISWERILNKLK